jgi:hypothetical protein
MLAKKDLYRLPDGTTTTSYTRYIKEYRALGKMVAEVTNGELYACAFDPGVLLCATPKGTRKYSGAVDLPSEFLLSLRDFLTTLGWKPKRK